MALIIIFYCDIICCEIVLTKLWLLSKILFECPRDGKVPAHALYSPSGELVTALQDWSACWDQALHFQGLEYFIDCKFVNPHKSPENYLKHGRQEASLERTARPNPSRSLQIFPLYPQTEHWSWYHCSDICQSKEFNLSNLAVLTISRLVLSFLRQVRTSLLAAIPSLLSQFCMRIKHKFSSSIIFLERGNV